MNLDLKNKIVIITGANKGIGECIAKHFLQEEACVAAVIRGDESKLNLLREWMKENKLPEDNLKPFSIDWDSTDNIIATVDKIISDLGRIHVLINNAGNVVEKPFLVTTDEEWDSILDIHLKGMIKITRAVLKNMLSYHDGSIVNVSSITGFRSGRGVSAYGSTKSAINRLTSILALEMGKKGIRVNAVAPGAIKTKMSSALEERVGEHVVSKTPLSRFGTVDEVAHAVLFLASQKTASYITGEILVVDGGYTL